MNETANHVCSCYDVKTLIIFTYGSRLFLNRKKITTTLPLHIQQLTKCYNVFYTLQGPGEGSFFFAWKLNPQSGIFIFSVQTQLRLRWNSKAYVEKIRKKMQSRDIVSGRFIWNFLSSKKHVIISALEIRFHAISHLLFLPDYCAKRRSG